MDNITNEEWKDIKDFINYQVSNLGRVRNKTRGNILSPNNNGSNYLSVQLGKGKRRYIHRLVAQEFIPNSRNCKEINHINGNRMDNRINNIEWCTRQDNINHKRVTGTQLFGSKIYRAILDEQQVVIIKRLLSMNKYKATSIAKVFNVSATTIIDIKMNRTWKHVAI